MKLIMENWRQFSASGLNNIDKLLAKSLYEVSNVKDPFFRRKLKNLSLKTEECQVYLKELNGKVKSVSFDYLIEHRNSGKITDSEVHEIWESSCKYDINMFESYSKLHAQLFDEMHADGLITEHGVTTNKGRLLMEQEEELTEQQINEIVNNLILEQDDEEELSPEELAAAQSTGRKALGKVGKAIGKVVMSPFKVLNWFKEKIWSFLEGMLKKLFTAIKTVGEKWDIQWIKSFVSSVESIVKKISTFCNKNKVLKVACAITKGFLVLYCVKLFVTAFLSMCGLAAASLGLGAAAGCAGGAVSGAMSENRTKQLNEVAGELCNAAAQASVKTASYTFKLIKGAIKVLAAGGEGSNVADEALQFVDKFSKIFFDGVVPKGAEASSFSQEQIKAITSAAKACGSEGAALVVKAVNLVQEIAAKGGEVAKQILNLFANLGAAVGKIDTMNAYVEVARAAEKVSLNLDNPELLQNTAKSLNNLGSTMGFDNYIPDFITDRAAGEIERFQKFGALKELPGYDLFRQTTTDIMGPLHNDAQYDAWTSSKTPVSDWMKSINKFMVKVSELKHTDPESYSEIRSAYRDLMNGINELGGNDLPYGETQREISQQISPLARKFFSAYTSAAK